MEWETIGGRLKWLRENADLRQEDVALEMDIDVRSLSGHETNSQKPNRNTFRRYSRFYNCYFNWLEVGEGEPFPKKVEIIYDRGEAPINKDRRPAPVPPDLVVDKDGLWGEGREATVDGKKVPLTLFTPPEGPAGPQTDDPETKPAIQEQVTRSEIALVRTLRKCGEEYAKRVYMAATIRAQNVAEVRRLETKEKLELKEDLEVLSTAAIE